jgi:hypothetical protein
MPETQIEDWQNEDNRDEWLVSDFKKVDSNRDNYHRCKHCKELFHQDQCILDNSKGYQCPNGCVEPFVQPPYESPLSQ